MRKKIVAGNWKMNGSREEAMKLTVEIRDMVGDLNNINTGIILAPSFVHLASVVQLLKDTSIGVAAQNCSSESSGAYTGEVSAQMIASTGATHVIIGHSERRKLFFETEEVLKRKVSQAHNSGLKVIYCIGESKEQRESGEFKDVILSQLNDGLFGVNDVSAKNTVIAYEPVWAIGTGLTATPEQAQEVHELIRSHLNQKYGSVGNDFTLLYGGSCNEKNAQELFALPDVDGGLIGGASLKSRSFVDIIKSYS
jgi:triosephosphate isomerase